MPKPPRHLEAKPLEELLSEHCYGDTKINCGMCYRRTNKVIKIRHRNYPQHGAASNRVMTICPKCRDGLVSLFIIYKLEGK